MNNHVLKQFVYNLYNLNCSSLTEMRGTYIGIKTPL